tara:strand:- start:457 stop:702 length:246 start_codon:yes stop_codon:yes gene_type:complete
MSNPDLSYQNLKRIFDEVFKAYLSQLGVTSIGIGDQKFVISVVSEDDKQRIPTEIKGVPVEILVSGEIFPLDNESCNSSRA